MTDRPEPKTFVFVTDTKEQYEIVAMDFKDACQVFSQTGVSIKDLLAVEEHSLPDHTDTIH